MNLITGSKKYFLKEDINCKMSAHEMYKFEF